MPSNSAAWYVAKNTKPLEIRAAPYTSPGANEIVIKNGALGINPADYGMQENELWPLIYPTILGEDVAGEVVEVGSAVSRFHKGDRVVGYALGLTTKRDCESAFQAYTVLTEGMTSHIPDFLPFERAAVLPLTLSTASNGLFSDGYLRLPYPTVHPKPTGKALLVWGGATCVGSCGMQLAIAAGYEVITTASPKNFDYVKKLGAARVFDYHSATIVEELIEALKGKVIAGALDCIGIQGVFESCVQVVSKSEGKKFIATVRLPIPENLPHGIEAKFVMCSDIVHDGVGKAVFVDYLPKALAEGKFIAAPDPQVVGKGLESVQAALDVVKRGMSAKKAVVVLE